VDSPPLANLALWLKAGRLALADGAGIASWPNLGVGGGPFVQAVPAQQPVFRLQGPKAKPTAQFHVGQSVSGPSGVLGSLDVGSSWTMSALVRLDVLVGSLAEALIVTTPGVPGSGPGLQVWFSQNAPRVSLRDGSGGVLSAVWPTVQRGVPFLWTVNYDGSGLPAGLTAYLNGLLQTPTATVNTLTSSVASSSSALVGAEADGTLGLCGSLPELLWYAPALDTLTREMVDGYLTQSYLSQPWPMQYASPRRPWC